MNIKSKTTNKKVNGAIEIYEKILPRLISEIHANKTQFEMSNTTNDFIAAEHLEFKKTITIKTYRPRWPWSKALAYVNRGSLRVNLNSRKLNRTIPSIVGSIAHEIVHVIDGQDKIHNYGHGSNSSKGKEMTAPYWIGRKAKALADERLAWNIKEL